MPAADIFSPEPNMLERRFAAFLAQRGAENGTNAQPSPESVQKISKVTKWIVALAALAGIVSGGVIGGVEIFMRLGVFNGMEGIGWREALPFWIAFFAFTGVVSMVEIALLYALALNGIARVTQHSGLRMSGGEEGGLFPHSLARAALEFPSPQVQIYGVDPYAYVSKWKLTALNIAYKLKVGVSSFLLRVFLRRLAARMAIRGMVPLIAGPLYAIWNAYIVWRIMTEARLRTLGPFAVDNLIRAHFENSDKLDSREKQVLLHAAGEMLTRGRDAHPNQIYLMNRLRNALSHDQEITLDWAAMSSHLPALEAAGQIRLLDLLTISCLIGSHMHRDQTTLLRDACRACDADLREDCLKRLRKDLKRGHQVTTDRLSATRSSNLQTNIRAD